MRSYMRSGVRDQGSGVLSLSSSFSLWFQWDHKLKLELKPTPDPDPSSSRSSIIEFGLRWFAVVGQSAMLPDRVRSLEDPVLPCSQPAENFRVRRLRSAETEAKLPFLSAHLARARSFLRLRAGSRRPSHSSSGAAGNHARFESFLRIKATLVIQHPRHHFRFRQKPRLQSRQSIAHR